MNGQLEVVVFVYVDGVKQEFSFTNKQSVQSAIARIVAHLKLTRPPVDYELRWFESGELIDPNQSLEAAVITTGSVLVLGPKVGIGG